MKLYCLVLTYIFLYQGGGFDHINVALVATLKYSALAVKTDNFNPNFSKMLALSELYLNPLDFCQVL